MRTAKTLIRLGGCPGWSESSLGAQSLCWFCHEVAHYDYAMRYITDSYPIARSWQQLFTEIVVLCICRRYSALHIHSDYPEVCSTKVHAKVCSIFCELKKENSLNKDLSKQSRQRSDSAKFLAHDIQRILYECWYINEFIKQVWENDKMRGSASILSIFPNKFNKLNSTNAMEGRKGHNSFLLF